MGKVGKSNIEEHTKSGIYFYEKYYLSWSINK